MTMLHKKSEIQVTKTVQTHAIKCDVCGERRTEYYSEYTGCVEEFRDNEGVAVKVDTANGAIWKHSCCHSSREEFIDYLNNQPKAKKRKRPNEDLVNTVAQASAKATAQALKEYL